MRKIKKNKNSNFMVIGIIYFVMLLTISTAYSFFNENLSLSATAGISQTSDDFEIEYTTVKDEINDGIAFHQYTVTLTYKGNKNVTGWELYLKAPYDTEITGCYNAGSCTLEGEVITIINGDTNANLSPTNQSVTIGIQFQTSTLDYTFETLGAKFYEEGETPDVPEPEPDPDPDPDPDPEPDPDPNPGETTDSPYIIGNLNPTGGWSKTSTYIFTLQNTSEDITIQSWSLEIYFPANSYLETCWGGSYEYNEKTGTIKISGASWAPTLGPSETAEINIYMTTEYNAPYIPTAGKLIAKTTDGTTIEKEITIGG